MKSLFVTVSSMLLMVSLVCVLPLQTASASRPAYVYDNGDMISSQYKSMLDSYLRKVDEATSVEIVVWTTASFYGHGIEKDGIEIHDRDMLANYIFNEVYLDGIKGIGKAGKDNGVLVLLSKEKDPLGGSIRIEVGRGLEGSITDGTAGAILDAYLVPARDSFLKTQNPLVFDQALMNTVTVLAQKAGYVDSDSPQTTYFPEDNQSDFEKIVPFIPFIIIFVIFFILAQKKKLRRGFSSGFIGGGFGGGGGGFGGGGGGSGGGGAGR